MTKLSKSIIIIVLLTYFISSFYLYKKGYFQYIQLFVSLILISYAIYDIKLSIDRKDEKLILKSIIYLSIFFIIFYSILSIL